jgi:hypothetical protein
VPELLTKFESFGYIFQKNLTILFESTLGKKNIFFHVLLWGSEQVHYG